MSIGRWVKAFCSISAETAGSEKMPWWKVILLSLWKVRILRRFLDKMQINVYAQCGESFLFYLCGKCGFS